MAGSLRIAACAALAAAASAQFTLYKVDPTPKNAVCLDGCVALRPRVCVLRPRCPPLTHPVTPTQHSRRFLL